MTHRSSLPTVVRDATALAVALGLSPANAIEPKV